MIREIVKHPDPRLRQLCSPVLEVSYDLRVLIGDMFETMYVAEGRGLAAPQVGELVRVFVMDTSWKDGQRKPVSFINPEILWCSPELQENEEGCLSIPETPVCVSRPHRLELMWLDETGAQKRGAFEGFDAACVAHEIDHLDGKLILDHEAAA